MDERLRDADRSQATILAAARDEFAEHGLGGARMDRIAERAGLNKRLIYYYFDDKEKLFEAVLEQAYLDIREEERQLHLLDLSWMPDAETDLAGYFVYRRDVTAGGTAERISGPKPIITPSYSDTAVASGHRYAYAVSAVDRDGNESPRSAEVEEGLPE